MDLWVVKAWDYLDGIYQFDSLGYNMKRFVVMREIWRILFGDCC